LANVADPAGINRRSEDGARDQKGDVRSLHDLGSLIARKRTLAVA
jgi:hypothetical protein